MAERSQPPAAWRGPVLAGLMAGLLLLLALAAANQQFHARLHADDSVNHGLCAVCALAQGQVDSPPVYAGWTLTRPFQVRFTTPHVAPLPQEVDLSVASSRGPPASVSLL